MLQTCIGQIALVGTLPVAIAWPRCAIARNILPNQWLGHQIGCHLLPGESICVARSSASVRPCLRCSLSALRFLVPPSGFGVRATASQQEGLPTGDSRNTVQYSGHASNTDPVVPKFAGAHAPNLLIRRGERHKTKNTIHNPPKAALPSQSFCAGGGLLFGTFGFL